MAPNGTQEPGVVGQEAINTDIITLTRFLTEEQTKHKEATGDFTYVVPYNGRIPAANMSAPQTPLPRPSVRIQEHILLHPQGYTDQRAWEDSAWNKYWLTCCS